MNKTKKLLLAVLAAAGMSGCATTQVADGVSAPAPQATSEPAVSRPVGYGMFGGYRYRRLGSVTGA